MSNDVKAKYRMFRSSKSGYYYWQDNDTGKQGTLGTPDKSEAQRVSPCQERVVSHAHLRHQSPDCSRLPQH